MSLSAYSRIIFIIFYLGFSSAWAYKDLRCVTAPTDPFDPAERVMQGKYRGFCLDTSTKRPVEILERTSTYVKFANFYHAKKFWIATLKWDSVEQVVFQIIRFKAPLPGMAIAHTQLRFILKADRPISLAPQEINNQQAETPVTVTDLVYSVQATKPYNVDFNIFLGQFNYYVIVGRMLSTAMRAEESFGPNKEEKEVVYQVPLKLDEAEKQSLLSSAVHRSDSLRLNRMYNTLWENCTTELFDLFDFNMHYRNAIGRFRISMLHLFDPVDGPSRLSLAKRDMIETEQKLPTLNAEFRYLFKSTNDSK